MNTDHQLAIRLKSFLSSIDLTDSPTARELYRAYCELNNSVAQRLVECEVLLQKKQKIEAVILAQQEPNLFDAIDTLFFEGRALLLDLADLYNWAPPNGISMDSVSNLRRAVSEMDDLRPLLTEFRRIARTDQVKNKLHLLREITRIDKGNPEWKRPLVEVENQYVSQIIREAQETILNKDFHRLEQIYKELKKTNWTVTVPTIVLKKIEKIVEEHKQDETKKRAAEILERINSSYGSFDVTGLDDAIVCWNEHCTQSGYSPDENEKIQLKEAIGYLTAEKKKQKEQQEFQAFLEQISSLIDSAAPLPQVEKYYAKAQASGLEIPDSISNRVENYRLDTEREQRTATLIRSLKIAGTSAVVLLVLAGAAYLGIEYVIEDREAKNLYAYVKAGKIVEAQALLKEIERKYPKLASRPKISKAKAELWNLVNQEKERVAEYTRLLKEIEDLLKVHPPEESLKDKVAQLEQYAKSDLEKARVREIRCSIDEAFARYADEMEEAFLKKIAALKKCRSEILAYMKRDEFDQAEKLLEDFEKIHAEILDLKSVSKELLDANKDLLSSASTLREILATKKSRAEKISAALKALAHAGSFAEIDATVRAYKGVLDTASPDYAVVERSIREIDYFKAILTFQGSSRKSIPGTYADCAYFTSFTAHAKRLAREAEARTELQDTIGDLQQKINRRKIVFIRVSSGGTMVDVYGSPSGISVIDNRTEIKVTMKGTDDSRITITGSSKRLHLTIGDEEYSNCTLICPERLTVGAIQGSQAPHQLLIEELFKKIHSIRKPEAVLRTGIECLEMIQQDPMCAPYWKMILSLQILEPLVPLDLSGEKYLSRMKDKLTKLQEEDNETGDPLSNRSLAKKIEMFFNTYDFAFDKTLKQNDFLRNEFYQAQISSRVVCLGFTFKENHSLKYTICSSMKSVETDVFCFDSGVSGTMYAGRYGKNGLILDDRFQGNTEGHLLFTFVPAVLTSNLLRKLADDKLGIDVSKIVWPDFWPQNMRGNTK